MRIALVSQEYPPFRSGGIATQTYAKAHGLAALGHEPIVLTHSDDARLKEDTDGKVRVIRIPGYDDRLPIATEIARWITYSARVAETLSAIQRHHPLDLIDFPEWGCEGYLHLLNRAAWNAVPVVVQLHGPLVMFAHTMGWPDRDSEFYKQGTAMEGTCLRLADAVFSSSRCSAQWCADYYGIEARNVRVIHTGVNTKMFRPRTKTSSCPTIIFIGKINENKGALQLFEAVRLLTQRHPRIRLRMVGDGESAMVDRLCQEAEASGGLPWLELPGRIAHDRLPAELAAADIFAAPSLYEGGPGFVYLEAMACGIPVIACRGSGASETVTDGKTGFLVDSQDVEGLVELLDRLLQNPALCAEVGANARQYVESHADSVTCMQELEAFYSSVARKPSGVVC